MTDTDLAPADSEFSAGPLLDAFIARLDGGAREATAAERAFITRVAEDYRPEELVGVTAADLTEALVGFWRFGAEPAGGEPAVRLVRAHDAQGQPLEADLLEIVQPDAPFLVDSVMGEIGEAGAEVKAMFHPIVGQGRARVSMIQVWLAPVGEERRDALVRRVLGALDDVRAATNDFGAMIGLMGLTIDELARAAPGDPATLAEDLEFLRWMGAGHFIFLGARTYEYPRTADGGYAAEEPLYRAEDSLGVLRDQSRTVLRRASEPAVLSAALRRTLEAAEPVVVAKSNVRSRVHRRVYMDYVGVRRYGDDGKPSGEVRFVGLFTSQAYDEPARETPLLRRKIERVMAATGYAPGTHNATRLANILETYPRDEIFQMGSDELLETALGILHLSDRPRVKLFVRPDPFDRFVSILLYAPRDRYDSSLREKAGAMLAAAYDGRVSAYYPHYTDAPLARVHYIIGVTPGEHRTPDLTKLEADVTRLARTWTDDLETAIRSRWPDSAAVPNLIAAYDDAFPAGYRDRYEAAEALADLRVIEDLPEGATIRVRAFRQSDSHKRGFRIKLYRRGRTPIPLAGVLPILEHMGLSALVEDGFQVTPGSSGGGAASVWVHDFLLDDEAGEHLSFDDIKSPFESAFMAVWAGRAESDGFNRLVLEIGATWREAALIRALARYRQQSGLDPSQAVQEAALTANPQVTRLILRMFRARFDPATGASLEARTAETAAISASIDEALQAVVSLDDDRALRRITALVAAMTRTNYFQKAADGAEKPRISFKIASRSLVDLPAPKPFAEIYISAVNVEGVHLRFGPVARGGLRWSDRRDDFRTEVLGLVKAQQVKNAVIVPVGAKGGFYPKTLPRGGAQDAIREEAVKAYRTFLHGLLDLTDNLDASGVVVRPPEVIAYDGDDPYLVVAADKGTATFSDIANGVAADYGFWLGDAFASGGSAGYDHKAMGITARGAWEGVKRHFRELGKDIQREPFTTIGVGDMSGDVFGNGMLLSKTTRLIAAFDHRDIFIDPDPDPAASWAERKRLFDLPRSSWNDYDRAAISSGGGVFSRGLKSIDLSPQIKALLDLKADSVSATELMTAILKARADLLYLGGIGTYVKAATESNLDVGDKANDAIRVNGGDLRCKVVGEGANLGFTQAGRIEFALDGGRIDTDAIDNSAGVDTSDHEVNIKILTGAAEAAGRLTRADRDALLASMTDDVAEHVLAHNYDQTLALTLLEADSVRDLEANAAFMTDLEARGRLDRALEGLPGAAKLAAREKSGEGLTRPELAVLLAYGKLDLFEAMIASAAPDDPHFHATLEGYFPKPMRRFETEMNRHRLRREIIATVEGNALVNLCGPTFPMRLKAAAGCDTAELVAAFEAARHILRFTEAWRRVEKLDGKVPAAGQTALFRELVYVLRGLTYWLTRRAKRDTPNVRGLIAAYQPTVDVLKTLVPAVLSPVEQKAAVRRAAGWIKEGAPKDIAHSIALMRPLTQAAAVSELSSGSGWPLAETAYVYHRVGGAFGFDKLRAAAGLRFGGDAYDRLAMRLLIEDMLAEQVAVAAAIMSGAGAPAGDAPAAAAHAAVSAWNASHQAKVKAMRRAIEDIERSGGGWSFAKLTIANGALRELAAG